MASTTDQAIFNLNGAPIPFHPGETVMNAALRAGVYIPHLCFHPELSPHGSCRLCIVEVNERTQTACTLQAASGLEVCSDSEQLNDMRKQLVQMLFIEGNHICPSCEFSGNCQLQALAYHLDMEESHFHFKYPKRESDATHADIFLDRDRCINCELCTRASHEHDSKNVFSLGGRGPDTHLYANSDNGGLGSTELTLKDRAAHICPVGALVIKEHAYTTPIGARLYDEQDIKFIGNKRPEQK